MGGPTAPGARASTAILFAVAFASVGLAGCLDALTPQNVETDAAAAADVHAALLAAFNNTHDHNITDLHRVAAGFDLVAFDPLDEGVTTITGELDVRGDVLAVAELAPVPGFFLVDIADPANPEVLGRWSSPDAGYGADVKLDPSGERAYLFTQPDPVAQLPVSEPRVDNHLHTAGPAGIYVVDITDPANMELMSFTEVEPRGVHMGYVHVVDGTTYLFTVHNRAGISIFAVEDDGTLDLVSRYGVPLDEELARLVDPGTVQSPNYPNLAAAHDVTVQKDPLTGDLVMMVPFGYHGLHVVDVNDPAKPTRIGYWEPPGGASKWYTHTAQLHERDGHRFIVVVPEVFTQADEVLPAPLWVVDATDYAKMSLLGEWTNPAGSGGEYLRFSTHNVQIVDGTVFMAHYHGGVVAIDVATEAAQREPTATGIYQPHMHGFDPYLDRMQATGYHIDGIPSVWDTVVKDGYVIAGDSLSGIYVLRHDGLAAGTAELTSIG